MRVDPFSPDSSCRPCGPGLITQNGIDCITDCVIKKGDHTYDLRPLRGYDCLFIYFVTITCGSSDYICFCTDFIVFEEAAYSLQVVLSTSEFLTLVFAWMNMQSVR